MAARPGLVLGLLAAGLLAPFPAGAHRLAPSLLQLSQAGSGLVSVSWKQSLLQPRGARLRPILPEHCRPREDARVSEEASSATVHWTADCGSRGLVGARLAVEGLGETGTAALLQVSLADGRRVRAVLDAGRSEFVVPARESRLAVARDYGAMGLRHIGTGPDHLLFLLGLVLLVRGGRALLGAVTAFTVGHSLSLSLVALGFLGVPPSLAELAIAGSLLLLALELAPGGASSRWARRPWPLALGFGWIHGLGFAGALGQVGLPSQEIPLALASFNLGIELGQLLFVLAGLGLAGPLRRLSPLPAYVLGSLAAFWCFERAAPLLAF